MRVAIVGFGLAGRVFHAPLVEAVDGLELSAIVTGNEERAAQARAAHPGARVVARVGEAWAEADVVVVATPNRFHAPIALAAIERGIPVVVDKPLATSVEEAERILDAGGRATVFQNRRWDGDFLTVRRLVEEGELGPVVRFVSRFERFRPQVTEGSWRELGDPAEGGGQLFDLGAHLVDQARLLFGHPLRVYAELDVRRPGGAADDDVFVALEHAGGVHSHLHMGTVAPLPAPRLQVSGLRGGFAVDGLDPQEPQLAGGMRPGEAGYGEREQPGRIVSDGGGRAVAIERGRYEDFYAGVRDWLAGGGPPPVDPRDSLDGLRVLEAARRSAATKTVIDLEDTPT
jgi:predicted dehydrogenase